MSPAVLKPQPTFTIREMEKTPKEKHDFGAVITGLDWTTSAANDNIKALSDAIWTHKVVVVKGQKHIHPMPSEPGLTAFFSNVQMHDLMTEEEKTIADHSWVEYAPHPYQWMGDCKGNANGLGLVSQGKEKNLNELGDYDKKAVKRYPMVWVNPVTGEKAFMVHGICVRRMFLRSSVDEKPKIVEDVVEIRKWLKGIQERVLKPEYILLPKAEEGDIIMWANYQMFRTTVDYHDKLGPRTMHQANIGASTGPVGPVPLPVAY